jgi:LPS O-antigen subunit length determinant protein (WzzB/FepE family)
MIQTCCTQFVRNLNLFSIGSRFLPIDLQFFWAQKKRFFIYFFVIFSMLFGASYFIPRKYQSFIIVSPSDTFPGSTVSMVNGSNLGGIGNSMVNFVTQTPPAVMSVFLSLLHSTGVAEILLKKHKNLLEKIMIDPKTDADPESLTIWSVYHFLKSTLQIHQQPDRSVWTIETYFKTPDHANAFLELIIKTANEVLSNHLQDELRKKKTAVMEKISHTHDAEHAKTLYRILYQIERVSTLIDSGSAYAAQPMSPALTSPVPVYPNQLKILAIIILLSVGLSSVILVLSHYKNNND